MERLSDDVLGWVLMRVFDGRDRKSCSQVSTRWFTIEALTRTRVRVLDPQSLHHFLLSRFPNLTALFVDVAISDQALMFVADCCPNLRTLEFPAEQQLLDDFGDKGLEAVARGRPHLTDVSLLNRNIGDAGIIALQMYAKELAVLRVLYCGPVTDLSLAAIGNMESITELYLSGFLPWLKEEA